MLKKPSQTASPTKKAGRENVTEEQAEALAALLADKPYGESVDRAVAEEKAKADAEKKAKTKPRTLSVSLPGGLIEKLEDAAHANKKSGEGQRTVSGIVREALEAAGFKL